MSLQSSSTTNLFEYSDFRSFLKDYFESRRQADQSWSYGVWARRLKLKSPSTLIMILNGQRNPGPELVADLCRYFGFSEKQKEYFEDLVRLHKTKRDPRLSVLLLERLSKNHPNQRFQFLDSRTFSAISNWYYYAIRELVNLADFQESPAWISKKLKGDITPKEAKTALAMLLELGLLKRAPDGRLTQADIHVDTQSDVADEALKRFHEQTLERARKSIRDVEPEFREVSGTTFAIKLSQLPRAKALIRKFRNDLCQLLEEPNSEAVFQLEMAFYPLTELKGNKS